MEVLRKHAGAVKAFVVEEDPKGLWALLICVVYISIGLPSQIIEIWRTKNVEGISLTMFGLMFLNSLSWLNYGYRGRIRNWIIVIPNLIASILGVVILVEYGMFVK